MAKRPSSSAPIWSKRTAQGKSAGPSERLVAYCAGRDVVARPAADAALLPYDVWTNRAHCQMLYRRKIINRKEWDAIRKGLDALETEYAAGKYELDPTLEDVHMNIERYVAGKAGEAPAGVMHTARSRNDQSATDVRLWLRDQLLTRTDALGGLVLALAKFAARHKTTLAPGWTHGQPAMPTTLGHWAAAHGEALARDLQALQSTWPLINENPLGSAASFGTSWPIDRNLTTRLLAFDRPTANSLDSISTRWEAETRVAQALAVMMTHLSSLAQDLIFLSTPPRAGLRLSDTHVTGSSIMPNKRNPDFAEVTRARAQAVLGLTGNLAGVTRGLLTGYNRDTQWSKYWIMDLLWETGEAAEIFEDVFSGLTVDKKVLGEVATAGFALAADLADHLARTRKLPFRRAYHVIAEAVGRDEAQGWVSEVTMNDILRREKISPLMTQAELDEAGDAPRVLKQRQSAGGPAPEQVQAQAEGLKQAAREACRWATAQRRKIEAARKRAAAAR